MGERCNKLHCKLLEEKEGEIIQLKQEIIAWKNLAALDQMTGTMNKISGLRKLQLEMEKTLKNKTSTTIAFVDIDGLKLINDKFGHCIGDELLVAVSDILLENIRKEDFVFRFGGDEFIIVFTNMTKLQAKEVWKRVHKIIDELNKKFSFPISLSVGFYEYDGRSITDVNEFIQLADSEMYRGKKKKVRGTFRKKSEGRFV